MFSVIQRFERQPSQWFQKDSQTLFVVNVGENEKQRSHNMVTLGLLNNPSDEFLSFSSSQTAIFAAVIARNYEQKLR